MAVDPSDRFCASWKPLLQLLEAWRASTPKRERGGRTALEGFAFQFHTYLLRAVRAWLAEDPAQRTRPSVFMELLSDIVEVSPAEGVLCSQVKLRQASANVSQALDEFWDIERLAIQHAPSLATTLRYRLVSTRLQLRDVRASIERWRPDGIDETDAALLESFKAKVDAQLLAAPLDDLLALLANELRARDPVALVSGWVDELLSAASGRQQMSYAATRIWNDLAGLQAEGGSRAPAGVYVWTEQDRAPLDVRPGEVLTGQRPRPWHLQQGYFTRRSAFDALVERAATWLDQQYENADTAQRIPVFWIGGRSGSGKSVALLHLLADLHDVGHRPIAWLGHNLTSLSDALQWAHGLLHREQRLLIALDDPYAPGTSATQDWVRAVSVFESSRASGASGDLPLLLCCGPTEQAKRLERELLDDIAMVVHELPHETTEEVAALREWFQRRTNSVPPEIGTQNVLLVQLFFEWRTGLSLPHFAQRLRTRLIAAEPVGSFERTLEALMSRMLAANRLYVGLPAAAISASLAPAQLDALSQLRRDHHIEGADDAIAARSGAWLAHPHLANAIFESWYGSDSPHVRAKLTEEADADCLTYGQSPAARMSLIWALGDALRSDADPLLAARVDHDDRRGLLARLHATHLRYSGGHLSPWQLPAWLQIRAHVPDLILVPDPLDESLRSLGTANVDEPGVRLVCHKLLEYLESWTASGQRVLASIATVLAREPQWREWPHVALDLMRRAPDVAVDLILEWVRAHAHHSKTPQLLLRGMASHRVSDYRSIARVLVAEADGSQGWARVAEGLFDGDRDADTLAAIGRWVATNYASAYACFVLLRLLKHGHPLALEWSLGWVRAWWHARVASFLLEALWDANVHREEVRDLCERWLSTGHEDSSFIAQRFINDDVSHTLPAFAYRWLHERRLHDNWFYVWRAAQRRWPAAPANDWDHDARAWICEPAAMDSRSWGLVWNALWARSERDDQLSELARVLLSKAPAEHGSWAFVWQALWARSPADDQLSELARVWLSKAPAEHGPWAFVWQALWERSSGDEQLSKLARTWLSEVPLEHGSWRHVWQALWEHTKGDEQLSELARVWLSQAPPEYALWRYTWKALWKRMKGDEKFSELARAWLSQAPPEHVRWRAVWQSLWERSQGDGQLSDLARVWLSKAPAEHRSWQYVWDALWERSPGDEQLSELACVWLSKASAERRSWQHVWWVLWERSPGDEQLSELACVWLSKASAEHRSWQHVWEVLWERSPGDEQLSELARVWLSKARPEHRSWAPVWASLWDVARGDPDLDAQARKWLTDAPHTHGAWKHVWLALRAAFPCDSDLATRARDWLATAIGNHGWVSVWSALRAEFKDDASLNVLAAGWLKQCDVGHRGRPVVYRQLLLADFETEEVLPQAMSWLCALRSDETWPELFVTLWEKGADHVQLRALGVAWLAEHSSIVGAALVSDLLAFDVAASSSTALDARS